MKIKWIDPSALDKHVKATIHKTGKLGFSNGAAKKLQLADNKSICVGTSLENPNDRCLYLIVHENKTEEGFKIAKSGMYYYLNTKFLFDSIGIDYKKEIVTYDITQETTEFEKVFKLKPRK